MAETLNTRVTRLEDAMAKLAESQARMDNALAHLAEVQAQAAVDREGDRAEAREREKRIDERIEKLVLAIAELVRRDGKTS